MAFPVLSFVQTILDADAPDILNVSTSPETWNLLFPNSLAAVVFREVERGPDLEEEEEMEGEEEIQIVVKSLHTTTGRRDSSDIEPHQLTVLKHYLVLSLDTPTVCPSMNGDDDLRNLLQITGMADCVVFPFKRPCAGALIVAAEKLSVSEISRYSNLGRIIGRALFGSDQNSQDNIGGLKINCLQNTVVRQRLKRATSESALKREIPIYDSTRECVVLTNANAEVLEWGSGAENLFGWSSLDVIGKNIASFLIPEPFKSAHEKNVDDYQRAGSSFVRATLKETVGRMLPCVHKDGSILNFRVTMGEMKREDQESSDYCVLFQLDPTASRETFVFPKNATQLMSGNVILLVDTEAKICFCNAAGESLFGYAAGEIIGQHLSMLLSGAEATMLDIAIRKSAFVQPNRASCHLVGETSSRFNFPRKIIPTRRKNGMVLPVHMCATIVDSERRLIAISIHPISDKMEKIQLEVDNERLRREISRLNGGATVGFLEKRSSSNIDIRTPLDCAIEQLRTVARSIFVTGDDCALLWSAISSLSQGGTRLLQPQMMEAENNNSDLDVTTRLWLIQQMGISMNSLHTSEQTPVITPRVPSCPGEDEDPVPATGVEEVLIDEGQTRILDVMRESDPNLDLFQLEACTNKHALMTVVLFSLEFHGLLASMQINTPEKIAVLRRFLGAVERAYSQDTSYHNATHAADVTYTCHCLLQTPAASGMPPLEKFALIFACSVHDMDHRGTNNKYQVDSVEELAVLYNDKNVMEMHHIAEAFKLLLVPELNFLAHMPRDQFKKFRSHVIDLVLITDMTLHFSFVSDVNKVINAQPQSDSDRPPLEGPEHYTLLSQALIKLSDLGHTIKPLDLHLKWSSLLQEEFFKQGDLEKKKGLPCSPFMDRNKDDPVRSQTGFFEFVLVPFVTVLNTALHLPPWIVARANANANHWKQLLEEQTAAVAAASLVSSPSEPGSAR